MLHNIIYLYIHEYIHEEPRHLLLLSRSQRNYYHIIKTIIFMYIYFHLYKNLFRDCETLKRRDRAKEGALITLNSIFLLFSPLFVAVCLLSVFFLFLSVCHLLYCDCYFCVLLWLIFRILVWTVIALLSMHCPVYFPKMLSSNSYIGCMLSEKEKE